MSQSEYVATNWRDYLEMCKPRVVLLMLLTAAVGMFLAVDAADGLPGLATLIHTMLGIALVAGSAAVVNHVADLHIDRQMVRTEHRPMARGSVSMSRALLFSAGLGVSGMAILALWVNAATAWLNLFSWIGYGVVYTLYLKRLTPQNIVIGGLFGAVPPLFGWTAITGAIELEPLLLVLIIFVWTPAHFWALALDRIDDYSRAGVPMLPVTHGPAHTRQQVLYYTLALCVASLLPFLIGMSGFVYLSAAVLLGLRFVYWSVALVREREGAAMATFRYSIIYLGLLFIALLADHYVSLI